MHCKIEIGSSRVYCRNWRINNLDDVVQEAKVSTFRLFLGIILPYLLRIKKPIPCIIHAQGINNTIS